MPGGSTLLSAWFAYAIAVSEMVYTMKLAAYEECCAGLLCQAVSQSALSASEESSGSPHRPPAGAGGAGSGDCTAPEALVTQLCFTRPTPVAKRAGDCMDAVEAELTAVYAELEEGYTVSERDAAALRASQQAHSHTLVESPLLASAGPGNHLLYGELTSRGVRQLHRLATQLIRSARGEAAVVAEDEVAGATRTLAAPAQTPGYVMVAVDIGSGTGKALFEWSRLAAREYLRYPWTPTVHDVPQHAPPPPPPAPPLARSPAVDAPHAEEGVLPEVREAARPDSALAGWLGVGIELAPSRMSVARAALAPHCLDLVRDDSGDVNGVLSGHSCGADAASPRAVRCSNGLGAKTSSARTHAGPPPSPYPPTPSGAAQVDPQPPCSPPWVGPPSTGGSTPLGGVPAPVHRLPAGCVLLYEGDALAPGLLSNRTLCRFPQATAATTEEEAPTVHSPALAACTRRCSSPTSGQPAVAALPVKEGARVPSSLTNYYEVCRGLPSQGRLLGCEEPHLVVFLSGLGFDAGFVRLLCERLEALLPGSPHDSGGPFTLSPASPASAPGAGDLLPCGAATTKEEGGRGVAVEGVAGSPPPPRPRSAQWRTLTFVLLLRSGLDLEDASFPLFRCCQRWDEAGSPAAADGCGGGWCERPHGVPTWCVEKGGLVASSASVTRLETTWMSAAPAWVLHFVY